MIYYRYVDAPIGRLMIAADAHGIRALEFPQNRHPVKRVGEWREGDTPLLRQAIDQLGEYFDGRRQSFDLPLSARGTPFQHVVWQALRDIPFGHTWSYAQLAQRIGKPTAMRAVGAANGRNPIPIIVPCHRVIGANGTLTGFGGGIDCKRFLLELEQRRAP